MIAYLVRRLLQSFFFVLVASLFVFTLFVYLMPDSPVTFYKGRGQNSVSPRYVAGDPGELVLRYKLDRPWPLSFLYWLFDPTMSVDYDLYGNLVPAGIDIAIGDLHLRGAGILTGNLGSTISGFGGRRISVAEQLSTRWDNTAWLVGASLVVTLLVAIPLGVRQAARRDGFFDHFTTFLTFAGRSVPIFVLGLVLIIFLAVYPAIWGQQPNWSWVPHLPAGGLGRGGETSDFLDRVLHLILPTATLALPQIAILSRYVRFSMLDVLDADYIRTARAIGLPAGRVVMKHAFRNAMLPAITVIALTLPSLASGSIVVESVFDYPGMGQLYFQALGGCTASISLLQTDRPPCPPIGPIQYPLALVFTMLLVLVTGLSTVVADVLYLVVDPRISVRGGRS